MTTAEVLKAIRELLASIDEEGEEVAEVKEVAEVATEETEETVETRTETTERKETYNEATGETKIEEKTEITFKDGEYYGI